MFLYWLPDERRYVHRQADIPKGVESERVDVPTDTAGLMAYLNGLVAGMGLAPPPEVAVELEDTPPRPVEVQISVEEAIQSATPVQLAVYAENVCYRIKELANALSS